jgi:hypothetical protein
MTRILSIVLLLLFGGCAAHRPCPALPNPPAKADFNSLSDYATTVATLYGECAGGTR